MDIVVVGAGVGGLGAALALSRQGHGVTMLERDPTSLPATAEEAFDWDRRGAPQVHHSHAMLARLRNIMRDRFPDVLQHLFDAGATEWRVADHLPLMIEDRSPRPGDDELVMLACRRTTFEWVLRRAVLATPGVTLQDGVGVDGLRWEPGLGGPPVVTGVHLAGGDELGADAVVMATGRRGDVPAWLRPAGVEVPEAAEDTGIIYLSRFYRLLPDAGFPPDGGAIGGDLGYLKYATFLGDNRTFSVTLATPSDDGELRSRLLEPGAFDAAARVLQATSPWLEPGRAEPITTVMVMAGLLNRQRTFTDANGEPVVSGFHAVGDAHTCTNPLYGQGCSLAMIGATALSDAFEHHPDDPLSRAREYEATVVREVGPWHRASVIQDRDGRAARAEVAALEAGRADGGNGANTGKDQRAYMRQVMRDGLFPAMRRDATVFRAFLRTFNLLTPPDALMKDTEVMTKVMTMFQERESRPPDPPLGPDTRADLLALLPALSS